MKFSKSEFEYNDHIIAIRSNYFQNLMFIVKYYSCTNLRATYEVNIITVRKIKY